MARAAAQLKDRLDSKEFAELLNLSLGDGGTFEGTVVKGKVVGFTPDSVLVDVGLKSEGRIPLKEFSMVGQMPDIKTGDSVEVYVERLEDKNGEAVLSREKARREESWIELEKSP